ncbi:MAG: L,D-transpeptidase family protein [Bacteriovoracaceae bacterium]|jgi:murein L,D-transpeptidase YafK|nr:L,D-transpeptidase family protein [Bacteriovoracaceae bacterium]
MKRIYVLLLTLSISTKLFAQIPKVLPAAIVQLDNFYTHHVVIAEKSTHSLHLFKNNNGIPELVKTLAMVSGKKAGDKLFQGDHRTPEGIFEFTQFLTHEDLLEKHGKQGEIYGVGAFVMNYPNPIDRRNGKTGGGIWLHSTNDETRIDKGLDSRGCLVTSNDELIEISQYFELHKTKVVVVHELKWLSEKAWHMRKDKINKRISDWKTAWETENLINYISSYHKTEFRHSIRGSLSQFRTYKRAVFNNPGQPTVEFLNTSILATDNYVLVTLLQNYQSATINDLGRKLLYLRQNEFYEYKIIHESWNKDGLRNVDSLSSLVAFKPSLRFFDTLDSNQILQTNLKKENN